MMYIDIHMYLLVLYIIGSVTNVFNVLVFTRKHMISSTSIMLTAISTADFVIVMASIRVVCSVILWEHIAVKSLVVFTLVCECLILVHHITSLWLTVVLAGSRFIFYRFPTYAVRCWTVKRTTYVVFVTYFVCICLSIPFFFAYRVTKDEHGNTSNSEARYYIGLNQLSQGRGLLLRMVNLWLNSIVLNFIACILLTVFIAFHIRALCTSRSHPRNSITDEALDTDPNSIIRVVLVIAVFFLLTTISEVIWVIRNQVSQSVSIFYSFDFGTVVSILTAISHALKFLVYFIFLPKFRKTLFSILSCKPFREEQVNSIPMTNISQT